MGRPCLLTEKAVTGLEKDLALGMTWRMASANQGIDYTTVRAWIIADEQDPGNEKYCNISNRCSRAREKAKIHAIIAWRKAFNKDWRAAHKFLACVDREHFSERHYIKHQIDARIQPHDLSKLSVEDLQVLRDLVDRTNIEDVTGDDNPAEQAEPEEE